MSRKCKLTMGGGNMVELPYENKVIFYMKLEKYKQRNPKKIGIAVFTIACVLLIAFVFIYSSFASFQTNETRNFINGNVVDSGDLYFAFFVDGVISSTIPKKGEGYVLDNEKTTCTNGATVEWLDDEWAPKINNLTQTRTKCTLYFKEQTFNDAILACNDTAANCLKNNASLNTAELVDDETVDHNIRYIGANPNNYVRFNNELWRIIGVFNNIDNGSGTKETRLKIIRNEPIGEYSWDNKPSGIGSSISSSGSNDWSDSRLMMLLNPGYEAPNSPVYEYEGSLYYNGKSGTCYSGSNGATVSCDFTDTGLQSTEAKEMIGNAVWKLGGSSTYQDVTASMFYERERGTTVYSERPTEWAGKIGLMYVSDYGYATSGGSTTNRETCLNTVLYDWESSSVSDCNENDWLYDSSNSQWFLTSTSSSSDGVFYLNRSWDHVLPRIADDSLAVSPALYLNSNVKISGGEGTEESPYTLSL